MGTNMRVDAFNPRNFGNDLFSVKNLLSARAFIYSLRERIAEEVIDENNIATQFQKMQYIDLISNVNVAGTHSSIYRHHNTDIIHVLGQDFIYVSIFVLLSFQLFKRVDKLQNKIVNNEKDDIDAKIFPSKLRQFDIYYDANRKARMFLLIVYIIFTKNVESVV
jgi:hypothetical protein